MSSTIWDLSQRQSSALTGTERIPLAHGEAPGSNAYVETRQLIGSPYVARVMSDIQGHHQIQENIGAHWQQVYSLTASFDTSTMWDAGDQSFLIPINGIYTVNVEMEVAPEEPDDLFDCLVWIGKNSVIGSGGDGGTDTEPSGKTEIYSHATRFFKINPAGNSTQVNITDVCQFDEGDKMYLFVRGVTNSSTSPTKYYNLKNVKWSISLLQMI